MMFAQGFVRIVSYNLADDTSDKPVAFVLKLDGSIDILADYSVLMRANLVLKYKFC